MKIVFCVADNNGISFNGRRVSRDMKILEDVAKEAGTGKIRLSPKSENIFLRAGIECIPTALDGDIPPEALYFAEDYSKALVESADEVIIYRFNRSYPADVFCEFLPSQCGFELAEKMDFPGLSHEKISKEIYLRRRDKV